MLALGIFDMILTDVLTKLGYEVTNEGMQLLVDEHIITIQLTGVRGGTPGYPGFDMRFHLQVAGPRFAVPYVMDTAVVLSEPDGLDRLPGALMNLEAGLRAVITRNKLN